MKENDWPVTLIQSNINCSDFHSRRDIENFTKIRKSTNLKPIHDRFQYAF